MARDPSNDTDALGEKWTPLTAAEVTDYWMSILSNHDNATAFRRASNREGYGVAHDPNYIERVIPIRPRNRCPKLVPDYNDYRRRST